MVSSAAGGNARQLGDNQPGAVAVGEILVGLGRMLARNHEVVSVGSTSMARKSLTLVRVGPVTTRSPSAANRRRHSQPAERKINSGRGGPRIGYQAGNSAPALSSEPSDAIGVAGDRREPRVAAQASAGQTELGVASAAELRRTASPWSRRRRAARRAGQRHAVHGGARKR